MKELVQLILEEKRKSALALAKKKGFDPKTLTDDDLDELADQAKDRRISK